MPSNNVDPSDDWGRQRNKKQFENSGHFDAWVAGTLAQPSSGSSGYSGCGFYIESRLGKELPFRFAFVSSEPDSDEQRATIAAVLGVCEAVPEDAIVTIRTRTEWIAEGIQGGLYRWKADGWKKGSGKRNGWPIWEKIIEEKERKSLTIEGIFCKSEDDKFAGIRSWAHYIAVRTTEDAGILEGSKLPYRKGQPRK